MQPLVSVVIPTYCRPQLVKRAVKSALAQTLKEIEVIVVIDGPHPETHVALAEINDPRLKIIELPTNQGSFPSRVSGIKAASAEWVALLDDDDEWMPQKLDFQLAKANASRYEYPIVSCYLIARTSQGDDIYPRRLPKESEPISEYLFVRNTLFQGEGLVQSSTIFTKRDLLQKIPTAEIKLHDDWEWLLQIIGQQGVGLEFVEQVLSIWHLEETHESLSRSIIWESSFNWIKSKRHLVTPRAYSSFILAEVSARSAASGDWKGLFFIILEAFRNGKPQFMDVCLCLGMWIFPSKIRSKLRNLLTQKIRVFPVDIKSKKAF